MIHSLVTGTALSDASTVVGAIVALLLVGLFVAKEIAVGARYPRLSEVLSIPIVPITTIFVVTVVIRIRDVVL